MFVLFSSLRTPEPYLLLQSLRPLSPPQRGDPDFLSTCLGIESLNYIP